MNYYEDTNWDLVYWSNVLFFGWIVTIFIFSALEYGIKFLINFIKK